MPQVSEKAKPLQDAGIKRAQYTEKENLYMNQESEKLNISRKKAFEGVYCTGVYNYVYFKINLVTIFELLHYSKLGFNLLKDAEDWTIIL